MGTTYTRASQGIHPGEIPDQKLLDEINENRRKQREENNGLANVIDGINKTAEVGNDIVKTLHDDVKDITNEAINSLTIPLSIAAIVVGLVVLNKN